MTSTLTTKNPVFKEQFKYLNWNLEEKLPKRKFWRKKNFDRKFFCLNFSKLFLDAFLTMWIIFEPENFSLSKNSVGIIRFCLLVNKCNLFKNWSEIERKVFIAEEAALLICNWMTTLNSKINGYESYIMIHAV